MDLASLVWGKLAASLLLALGFGVATAVYLSGVPSLCAGVRVGAMLAIVYAFSIQDPEYRWFTFFLLVLLVGLLADGRASLVAFAVGGLLAGFYLLIKFSLGLSSAVTLLVGCWLVRRPRVVATRLAVSTVAAAAGLLAGWFCSGGALAGIPSYLTTGLEVAKGYSVAASAHGERSWVAVAAFLVWFSGLAFFGLVQPCPRKTIVLTGLAFPLFTAWKHSIVRQDVHVAILVRFGIFVIVLLLIETVPAWGWRRALPAAGSLLVPLAVAWMTMDRVVSPYAVDEVSFSPFPFRGVRSLDRLLHLDAYRQDVEHRSRARLRADVLPASLRQRIGQAPVDVYPWNVAYVRANQLSWIHRPFPMSFNAYSPSLEGLNAAFFRSDRRPEFLIWHHGFGDGMLSIDGRYLLWDEPQTLRAIVDHYDVIETSPRVLLLQVVASPRFEPPQLLGTSLTSWGARTMVPDSDGVLLAAPSIPSSLALNVLHIVFRGQPVLLRVSFSSGEDAVFRLVSYNAGNGFWLSPLAATFAELPRLFGAGVGRRVTAITFHGNALLRLLAPSISVTWFRMVPREALRAGVQRTRASGPASR